MTTATPMALGGAGSRDMVVLEDPGGEPLARLCGAPMEMGLFLDLAVGIAAALGQVHQRGLVHKDLKPDHILVNSTTGEVKLTGFDVASRLPRQRQAPEAPEAIAGTLPYMAPEQTGRMNRSIDSRSDLYALGVTLYEMLTGHVPFTASDPMELMHSHIARQPMPVSGRVKHVPVPVSQIIMKLLAKAAEERYQSAAGLERDLRRCLAQWLAERRIDSFPLGEHDTLDRLLIPEKLYGREREVEALLAAFDRMIQVGTPELVLVSGYAGIGKSSVVDELHKVLVPPRGLFASGKFDQYKRDIPYSTLAQAFQSLVRPLLAKSDSELSGWRDALREALGPNGQLMVDLVPELRLIIGDQPTVPELPPQDAQRRFQLVFRRFVGVFARPEHPLALFLDDLHWLDAATLDLLEDLLTRSDPQYLLLIGAYRDNEVNASHPLRRKLERIKGAGRRVAEIALAPLAREHLGQLIVDALRCEPERARPLTQLVHDKTAGNPFFAIQFMSSLAEEGMLSFDYAAARWSWDFARIHAKRYTDNVVDLMVGKLTRLPAETQHALQQLACLGNIAETTTLSIVLGTSEEQVDADLWEAARLELIARLDDSYKFVHDRIQEAVYSLIPEEARGHAHLRIGRLLAASTPPEKREEAIFEIVNQLNRGSALMAAPDEREQLAEFNLIAGKRAKASTAYASALTYLAAGAALLPENAWERRHGSTFALELHRAECEFLTGALGEAEARLAELAGRAVSFAELATVTRLRGDLFMTLGRSDRAVAVALDCLRRIGIAWSEHPTKDEVRQEYARMWQQLGDRPIEALIDLPPMADPAACATMDVLGSLMSPASFTDENLRPLVIGRMVTLSLEHGNSDSSCWAYAAAGNVLGPFFGDYNAGFRFGLLALELVERRALDGLKPRVSLAFGILAKSSIRHFPTGRAIARHAFDAALWVGDLTYAAFSCNLALTELLASGNTLAEVQREAEAGLDFARQAKFGTVVDIITGQLCLIRTLQGLTKSLDSFTDAAFDEGEFEERLEVDPNLAYPACEYWIRKLQARVFAEDYSSALEAAVKAQPLLWTSPAFFEQAEYHFYAALARAASLNTVKAVRPDQRILELEALAAHHRQLEILAEYCPENFENRAALVGAEIARLEGRDLDAQRLYEQAIRSAHANGFVHNEALAYEVAARFYMARGFEVFAHAYLWNARDRYLRWGAAEKVRQLDDRYPRLKEEPAPAPTSVGTPIEHLDLATVIKVSQAVSGEIVLERLVDTLMRTAIEQAGAGRGLLILLRGTEQYVAAEATTSGETVVVHLRDETVTGVMLPESILHYVVRTRESLILDDAAAQPPFAADPYVREHQARSIFCLPLLNQAKLIGLLYLENNLSPHVFSPARLTMLKLLASQAAISLENTRLYRDLEEREARIRRLVDANIIGIFIWELEGRILEANDAFLTMVGYDREDLVAGRLRWTDLTPQEWLDRDERRVPELKMSGSLQPFEKEYFRKDGSRVPVLIGVASFEEGGNQGVAFVLDLTDRKRAETALKRSEVQLAEGQRLSHTGSWSWNAATGALFWSQEQYRIFGLDPEQEAAPTYELFLNMVHPDDRLSLRRHFEDVAERGRDFEAHYRIVRGDGTVRYIHTLAYPVFAESGELAEYTGTLIDTTEQKRAAMTLLRTQDELAHVARVMSMGELTASIAHEVNQPLSAITINGRACLRWLAAEPSNIGEVQAGVECIIRDAYRASEVIARTRAFLKRGEQQRASLQIRDVLEEVANLVQGEARARDVSIRVRAAGNLPPVMGDRVQLQQVVLNFALNAIEAMRAVTDRPRMLEVGADDYNDGDSVLITVKDSGLGLDPQHIDRVFDAFFTTKREGMGMGLAISRTIVEAHGGRLWATNNPSHGATFQFVLPRGNS